MRKRRSYRSRGGFRPRDPRYAPPDEEMDYDESNPHRPSHRIGPETNNVHEKALSPVRSSSTRITKEVLNEEQMIPVHDSSRAKSVREERYDERQSLDNTSPKVKDERRKKHKGREMPVTDSHNSSRAIGGETYDDRENQVCESSSLKTIKEKQSRGQEISDHAYNPRIHLKDGNVEQHGSFRSHRSKQVFSQYSKRQKYSGKDEHSLNSLDSRNFDGEEEVHRQGPRYYSTHPIADADIQASKQDQNQSLSGTGIADEDDTMDQEKPPSPPSAENHNGMIDENQPRHPRGPMRGMPRSVMIRGKQRRPLPRPGPQRGSGVFGRGRGRSRMMVGKHGPPTADAPTPSPSASTKDEPVAQTSKLKQFFSFRSSKSKSIETCERNSVVTRPRSGSMPRRRPMTAFPPNTEDAVFKKRSSSLSRAKHWQSKEPTDEDSMDMLDKSSIEYLNAEDHVANHGRSLLGRSSNKRSNGTFASHESPLVRRRSYENMMEDFEIDEVSGNLGKSLNSKSSTNLLKSLEALEASREFLDKDSKSKSFSNLKPRTLSLFESKSTKEIHGRRRSITRSKSSTRLIAYPIADFNSHDHELKPAESMVVNETPHSPPSNTQREYGPRLEKNDYRRKADSLPRSRPKSIATPSSNTAKMSQSLTGKTSSLKKLHRQFGSPNHSAEDRHHPSPRYDQENSTTSPSVEAYVPLVRSRSISNMNRDQEAKECTSPAARNKMKRFSSGSKLHNLTAKDEQPETKPLYRHRSIPFSVLNYVVNDDWQSTMDSFQRPSAANSLDIDRNLTDEEEEIRRDEGITNVAPQSIFRRSKSKESSVQNDSFDVESNPAKFDAHYSEIKDAMEKQVKEVENSIHSSKSSDSYENSNSLSEPKENIKQKRTDLQLSHNEVHELKHEITAHENRQRQKTLPRCEIEKEKSSGLETMEPIRKNVSGRSRSKDENSCLNKFEHKSIVDTSLSGSKFDRYDLPIASDKQFPDTEKEHEDLDVRRMKNKQRGSDRLGEKSVNNRSLNKSPLVAMNHSTSSHNKDSMDSTSHSRILNDTISVGRNDVVQGSTMLLNSDRDETKNGGKFYDCIKKAPSDMTDRHEKVDEESLFKEDVGPRREKMIAVDKIKRSFRKEDNLDIQNEVKDKQLRSPSYYENLPNNMLGVPTTKKKRSRSIKRGDYSENTMCSEDEPPNQLLSSHDNSLDDRGNLANKNAAKRTASKKIKTHPIHGDNRRDKKHAYDAKPNEVHANASQVELKVDSGPVSLQKNKSDKFENDVNMRDGCESKKQSPSSGSRLSLKRERLRSLKRTVDEDLVLKSDQVAPRVDLDRYNQDECSSSGKSYGIENVSHGYDSEKKLSKSRSKKKGHSVPRERKQLDHEELHEVKEILQKNIETRPNKGDAKKKDLVEKENTKKKRPKKTQSDFENDKDAAYDVPSKSTRKQRSEKINYREVELLDESFAERNIDDAIAKEEAKEIKQTEHQSYAAESRSSNTESLDATHSSLKKTSAKKKSDKLEDSGFKSASQRQKMGINSNFQDNLEHKNSNSLDSENAESDSDSDASSSGSENPRRRNIKQKILRILRKLNPNYESTSDDDAEESDDSSDDEAPPLKRSHSLTDAASQSKGALPPSDMTMDLARSAFQFKDMFTRSRSKSFSQNSTDLNSFSRKNKLYRSMERIFKRKRPSSTSEEENTTDGDTSETDSDSADGKDLKNSENKRRFRSPAREIHSEKNTDTESSHESDSSEDEEVSPKPQLKRTSSFRRFLNKFKRNKNGQESSESEGESEEEDSDSNDDPEEKSSVSQHEESEDGHGTSESEKSDSDNLMSTGIKKNKATDVDISVDDISVDESLSEGEDHNVEPSVDENINKSSEESHEEDFSEMLDKKRAGVCHLQDFEQEKISDNEGRCGIVDASNENITEIMLKNPMSSVAIPEQADIVLGTSAARVTVDTHETIVREAHPKKSENSLHPDQEPHGSEGASPQLAHLPKQCGTKPKNLKKRASIDDSLYDGDVSDSDDNEHRSFRTTSDVNSTQVSASNKMTEVSNSNRLDEDVTDGNVADMNIHDNTTYDEKDAISDDKSSVSIADNTEGVDEDSPQEKLSLHFEIEDSSSKIRDISMEVHKFKEHLEQTYLSDDQLVHHVDMDVSTSEMIEFGESSMTLPKEDMGTVEQQLEEERFLEFINRDTERNVNLNKSFRHNDLEMSFSDRSERFDQLYDELCQDDKLTQSSKNTSKQEASGNVFKIIEDLNYSRDEIIQEMGNDRSRKVAPKTLVGSSRRTTTNRNKSRDVSPSSWHYSLRVTKSDQGERPCSSTHNRSFDHSSVTSVLSSGSQQSNVAQKNRFKLVPARQHRRPDAPSSQSSTIETPETQRKQLPALSVAIYDAEEPSSTNTFPSASKGLKNKKEHRQSHYSQGEVPGENGRGKLLALPTDIKSEVNPNKDQSFGTRGDRNMSNTRSIEKSSELYESEYSSEGNPPQTAVTPDFGFDCKRATGKKNLNSVGMRVQSLEDKFSSHLNSKREIDTSKFFNRPSAFDKHIPRVSSGQIPSITSVVSSSQAPVASSEFNKKSHTKNSVQNYKSTLSNHEPDSYVSGSDSSTNFGNKDSSIRQSAVSATLVNKSVASPYVSKPDDSTFSATRYLETSTSAKTAVAAASYVNKSLDTASSVSKLEDNSPIASKSLNTVPSVSKSTTIVPSADELIKAMASRSDSTVLQDTVSSGGKPTSLGTKDKNSSRLQESSSTEEKVNPKYVSSFIVQLNIDPPESFKSKTKQITTEESGDKRIVEKPFPIDEDRQKLQRHIQEQGKLLQEQQRKLEMLESKLLENVKPKSPDSSIHTPALASLDRAHETLPTKDQEFTKTYFPSSTVSSSQASTAFSRSTSTVSSVQKLELPATSMKSPDKKYSSPYENSRSMMRSWSPRSSAKSTELLSRHFANLGRGVNSVTNHQQEEDHKSAGFSRFGGVLAARQLLFDDVKLSTKSSSQSTFDEVHEKLEIGQEKKETEISTNVTSANLNLSTEKRKTVHWASEEHESSSSSSTSTTPPLSPTRFSGKYSRILLPVTSHTVEKQVAQKIQLADDQSQNPAAGVAVKDLSQLYSAQKDHTPYKIPPTLSSKSSGKTKIFKRSPSVIKKPDMPPPPPPAAAASLALSSVRDLPRRQQPAAPGAPLPPVPRTPDNSPTRLQEENLSPCSPPPPLPSSSPPPLPSSSPFTF